MPPLPDVLCMYPARIPTRQALTYCCVFHLRTVCIMYVSRQALVGPSVFDLSLSAGPQGSEAAGGREKTKTENTGGPGGQGARLLTHPPAQVAQYRALRTVAASAFGPGPGCRGRTSYMRVEGDIYHRNQLYIADISKAHLCNCSLPYPNSSYTTKSLL